jgi:hypothetical protein
MVRGYVDEQPCNEVEDFEVNRESRLKGGRGEESSFEKLTSSGIATAETNLYPF